jgi:hypothetical protein
MTVVRRWLIRMVIEAIRCEREAREREQLQTVQQELKRVWSR